MYVTPVTHSLNDDARFVDLAAQVTLRNDGFSVAEACDLDNILYS